MQKKLLILLTLISLTSCTLSKGGTADFTSLYRAHLHTQIAEMHSFGERFGYLGRYEISGTLHAMADIPTLFSGSLDTGYSGLIESYGISQDSSLEFTAPQMQYEMFLSSGSISADKLAMITKGGDSYLRYENLRSLGMYDDIITDILSKYEKSWLSITEADMLLSLSGSSDTERFAYQMSQALSRIGLDEVEKYLRDYPIWRETKSLGTIDGLETYEVELAKENILLMVDAFALESTGKKLSDEARASLDADLTARKITGTIGYDKNNPAHASLTLDITSPTGGVAQIILKQSSGIWDISISASGTSLVTHIERNADTYTLGTKIGNGTDSVDIDATLKYDKARLATVDATLSASEQGLSIKLHHTYEKNGVFMGNLDGGVGNLSWSGKIEESALSLLKIKGAMIGSSLSLDLTPGTGGLLRGPFSIKSGDDTVIEADVGLRIDHEHLDLSLDIPSPESPTLRSHAEISLTGKKEKSTKNIEIPKDARPFSDLATEISALAPSDELWNEEAPNNLTGIALPLDIPDSIPQ